MSWAKSSFRGVPFNTRVAETAVGQRKAVYDFPFDDAGAAAFDLGRRPRSYEVEALLYTPEAGLFDRLVKALEEPGPGLFIHPTRGPINVIVSSEIRITEDSDQQLEGVPLAHFRFSCVEARERAAVPVASVDAHSAVTQATATVRTQASAAMVAGTRLAGAAAFIRSAHLTTLDNVISDLSLLNGTISAALAVPGTFATQIASISAQLVTLMDTPDQLFAAIDGAASTIIGAANNVVDAGVDTVARDASTPGAVAIALAALTTAATSAGQLGSASTAPAPTPVTTPEENGNMNVTLRGLRASALCAAVEAALDATYASRDDATAVLDALQTQIDLVAEQPIRGLDCPDGLFDALQDLRATLTAAVNALQLSRLVDFTPGETSDAAVIAYTLYGDAERAEEIWERSSAAHPGAIPGLVPFQVLDD